MDFDHSLYDSNIEPITDKHSDHIRKDIFTSIYFDQILNLHDEFRSRFSISPYFLASLQATNLSTFVQRYIDGSLPIRTSTMYNTFSSYYREEVCVSYKLITAFLRCHGFSTNRLSDDVWLQFCYAHSDLYELSNYSQYYV